MESIGQSERAFFKYNFLSFFQRTATVEPEFVTGTYGGDDGYSWSDEAVARENNFNITGVNAWVANTKLAGIQIR